MSQIKNNLDLAFDFIVLISLLIAAISGFKLGFLQSLFKGIGYIAGGVLGVFIAANYLSNLDSILIKVLSSVVIILLSAVISQYILGRLGLLLHKGLIFAPFKALDSILGLILSVIKTIIVFYTIFNALYLNSTEITTNYFNDSKIYQIFDKFKSQEITNQ